MKQVLVSLENQKTKTKTALAFIPEQSAYYSRMEPRTGFEPVTSSLPWMRSTN